MSSRRSKQGAVGARVRVGALALHVRQLGAGGPTVIFENGLGGMTVQWSYIQAHVAQRTHTLSYDRAGQGWSDPSPAPRTPEQLAAELHRLLNALQVAPPFLLVAHSFGGLLSRFFAQRYPGTVRGMVLVDASHEMQMELIDDYPRRHTSTLRALRAMSLVARVPGLGRPLAARMYARVRGLLTAAEWQQFMAIVARPNHHAAIRAEMTHFDTWFGQQHAIPTRLGDLPLIVVTAAESLLHERAQGKLTAAQLNDAHLRNQAELARMSSNGRQVVVPKATHLSILSRPEHARYVIAAVDELLGRGEREPREPVDHLGAA